ncbi:glycine zipper 2TM domain-containing protein [Verrucomicrobiota bacterium]
MKLWMKTLTLLTVLAMITTGCATRSSGVTYTTEQARTAQQVAYGTVTGVREVTIQDAETGLGGAAGGVAGGVAGSTIGEGKGSTLGAVAGALAGAAIGHMAEKKMRTDAGLEIEVKKENGQIISVVQTADVMFEVGERVRILTGDDGTIRVTKD